MTTMADSPAPVLISIMLNIGTEIGHAYSYNRSVGAAAARLGWRHLAAVQTGCTIRPLPPDWEICLHPVHYLAKAFWLPVRRSLVPDAASLFRSARTIAAYLRRAVLPLNRPAILFLEFFAFTHLMALALALLAVPRRDLSVWLLYRYDVHRHATRYLYKWLNALLARLVGANRLVLMTDSDRLARSLGRLFGRSLTVMPIPHTELAAAINHPAWATAPERDGKILCWWPGRPAQEKGLETMRRLAARQSIEAQQLSLVAAQASGLAQTPGGPLIKLIEDDLPRPDYLGWLQAADLILLPYESAAYAERTSGILIEAIAAGKLAAVTGDTWMADELLKYDAASLIVDWDKPDLPACLARLAKDTEAQRRVADMQAAYARWHTEQSYAQTLKALYEAHH